ncbi:uncharacterized protein K460DRAFT_403891 [Cucurbitaria berberidis CBS 394.84]|uniref:Uncharacterized protein n=1 Tax=Cucurbitaria berberidis CBS 394.84 TaxID=1168544 RepID=A0A9P4GND6_9PLEO|nr:uncharacterized protein K460DRAFT_403891 [Cucurbitaria berberidis CBS 394.84]KAF1848609.1 hypothetical protein K460DRAFT_403891 [Cucurbitaria berberidis CBS 394.84]
MSQLLARTKASQSPLLRLCGEIRNRIFEYALTSSTPLHHSLDTQTPRFAVTMVPVPQFLLNISQHPILIEENVLRDLNLRQHPEFNQLKYVNKQLYAETAGLEIQYNTILFSPQMMPHQSALHQKTAEQCFLYFLAPMEASKMSWLTTVIIDSRRHCLAMLNANAPLMPDLPAIVLLCKTNPDIKVRYQFRNWEFDCYRAEASMNFLSAGVALTVALKGTEAGKQVLEKLLDTSRIWVHGLAREANHWRETWYIRHLLKGVKNFAFWPTAIATDISRYIPRDGEIRNIGKERLTQWEYYANSWIEHGIDASE